MGQQLVDYYLTVCFTGVRFVTNFANYSCQSSSQNERLWYVSVILVEKKKKQQDISEHY